MGDFTFQDVQNLLSIIRKVARDECNKVLKEKNIEHSLYGTITSVNGNLCNVRILGANQDYTNMINKTGGILAIGDNVLIKAINGNCGNAYIAIKLGV